MTTDSQEKKQGTVLLEDIYPPRQYKVLLHNDDYSTMDFVVEVLMRVFKKNEEEAVAIMLAVHKQQVGLCGIYTYEIAETKVAQVVSMARERSFPLRCTMEEA